MSALSGRCAPITTIKPHQGGDDHDDSDNHDQGGDIHDHGSDNQDHGSNYHDHHDTGAPISNIKPRPRHNDAQKLDVLQKQVNCTSFY